MAVFVYSVTAFILGLCFFGELLHNITHTPICRFFTKALALPEKEISGETNARYINLSISGGVHLSIEYIPAYRTTLEVVRKDGSMAREKVRIKRRIVVKIYKVAEKEILELTRYEKIYAYYCVKVFNKRARKNVRAKELKELPC